MKSRIVRAALAMSALLVFGIVVVFAQPKGDTVKVKYNIAMCERDDVRYDKETDVYFFHDGVFKVIKRR